MLFRLSGAIWNVLHPFAFYKVAERMRNDQALIYFESYRETKIDWSSLGGFDEFVAHNFVTGTLHDYSAGNIEPFKRKIVHDGTMVPAILLAVDMDCYSSVVRKTFSEVELDY